MVGLPPAKALEGVHPGWARMKGAFRSQGPQPCLLHLPVALMGLGLELLIASTWLQWGTVRRWRAAQQEARGPHGLQGSILSGSESAGGRGGGVRREAVREAGWSSPCPGCWGERRQFCIPGAPRVREKWHRP